MQRTDVTVWDYLAALLLLAAVSFAWGNFVAASARGLEEEPKKKRRAQQLEAKTKTASEQDLDGV